MCLTSTVRASLVAQIIKNLPAMQETWFWSLGREDSLEREWQPIPVFLPGESHGQRLQSMGSQRVGHNWATNTFTFSLWNTFTFSFHFIHYHFCCFSSFQALAHILCFAQLEFHLRCFCDVVWKQHEVSFSAEDSKTSSKVKVKILSVSHLSGDCDPQHQW